MLKATSARTRALIRQGLTTDREAERAVARFASDGRTAVAAFDADVDPLHLADDDYEHAVTDSGLRAVLDVAARIISRADPRSE